MQPAIDIERKLQGVFPKREASVLADVITDAYNELVKTSDFNELKGIVKELAGGQKDLVEAQKRTEVRMEELTGAQKRTEVRMEELAGAQKRTEVRMEELAGAQKDLVEAQGRTEEEIRVLVKGMNETRGELGGLSRSVSYGFENEAYRMLPPFLEKTYGIQITEKLIRAEIGGREINILGKARKNGQTAIVVGEAKLRLEDRKKKGRKKDIFEELEDKVEAVRHQYKKQEIVRILVAHYATKGFLKKAKDRGVLVIQSFEW